MAEKREMMVTEQEETGNINRMETEEVEDGLVISLKKPYLFEGKTYTEIDLTGMEELTGEDMIAINKIMQRTSPGAGTDVMPEVSTEYACYFAAKAAKLPVEFFMLLPAWAMLRVKNRVMGFLFGSD